MELVSIQVGAPEAHIAPDGEKWQSGIFKQPVKGAVMLRQLNLDGDGQADLKNHGGLHRAVLAYSADHYPRWREELAMPNLPFGAFGENFTISGQDETTVCIGDIYAIGEAVVQVAQPRLPCRKLNLRWGRDDILQRVIDCGCAGWYLRVLEEGEVQAGLAVRLLERAYAQWTIATVVEQRLTPKMSPEIKREIALCDALNPEWREWFLAQSVRSL